MLMATKQRQNFRAQLPDSVKEQWDRWLEKKRISQQDAAAALVEWVMETDDRLASLVLRQVDEEYHGQIAELVLCDLIRRRGGRVANGEGYAIIPRTEGRALPEGAGGSAHALPAPPTRKPRPRG